MVQQNKTSHNKPDSVKKSFGRYYTPAPLVREILDLSNYRGETILRKRVIDNSCGDGAFLVEIVDRYCQEALKSRVDDLKTELETYVYGIEIDANERAKCVSRLDSVAERYGVVGVAWNVTCEDALQVDRYDGKMDFVLGNPPYVRVHNLGASFNDVKRFQFAQGGMTDLYLVFYEIGLNMLNERGTLGYITPSSFFNSLAGNSFRKRLVEENLLDKIVDLKHYQAFDATTYSVIAVLKKNRVSTETKTFEYDGRLNSHGLLTSSDFYIDGSFYFSNRERLSFLKSVLTTEINGKFEVKNGFATLADSFFIRETPFEFDEFVIPVVKASTAQRGFCLFPYQNARLVPFEELTYNPKIREYYVEHETALKKRSITNPREWFGFGRTQGINDVLRPKFAVNALIRDANDVKLTPCPQGVGVYGGLYVLTNIQFDELNRALRSEDFSIYVALLKKYKSGGYYAFSSKDLKKYLEYSVKNRR